MSEDYLCYNLLLCILLRGILNSNVMFCEIFKFRSDISKMALM